VGNNNYDSEKLQLKNFRCFENIEVNFHDHLSVIVGVNGAGKTAIMDGAAIAISAMFIKMNGLTARQIEKGQAHLKTYDVGSTKDVQAQYPVAVSAEANCFVDNFPETSDISWTRSLNSPEGKTLVNKAKNHSSRGTVSENGSQREQQAYTADHGLLWHWQTVGLSS
jgi:predicted ATPase